MNISCWFNNNLISHHLVASHTVYTLSNLQLQHSSLLWATEIEYAYLISLCGYLKGISNLLCSNWALIPTPSQTSSSHSLLHQVNWQLHSSVCSGHNLKDILESCLSHSTCDPSVNAVDATFEIDSECTDISLLFHYHSGSSHHLPPGLLQ